MQYMLMCCIEEALWTQLPGAERDRIMAEYGKWAHELKQSGRLLAGAQLEQRASAVTVRRKNGHPVVTDGPFAETKEQFGGYHLLECRDRDEAIALALRIPTLAVGGSIEVRPVLRTE
ncbi:MAG: YciI family protein [Gemmataceae bacterium]|nr:YciI family protein [Gemmataceae bacterium]